MEGLAGVIGVGLGPGCLGFSCVEGITMCGGVIVPPFAGIPSTDGGSTAGNVTDGGSLPSAVVMVAGVVVRPLL